MDKRDAAPATCAFLGLIMFFVCAAVLVFAAGCKQERVEWRGLPEGAVCSRDQGDGAALSCVADGTAYTCVGQRVDEVAVWHCAPVGMTFDVFVDELVREGRPRNIEAPEPEPILAPSSTSVGQVWL